MREWAPSQTAALAVSKPQRPKQTASRLKGEEGRDVLKPERLSQAGSRVERRSCVGSRRVAKGSTAARTLANLRGTPPGHSLTPFHPSFKARHPWTDTPAPNTPTLVRGQRGGWKEMQGCRRHCVQDEGALTELLPASHSYSDLL